MIKIPYEKIVEEIKKKSNLDEAEITDKIDRKLKQLSGLISREGAAHIIANELGIRLIEKASGKLDIKNVLQGMRDVETAGVAKQIFDVREFKTEKTEGKVGSLIITDETGSIRVVLWGDKAELLKGIKQGDVVKVVGAYVRERQGRLELHLNDRSQLIINPKGISIDVRIDAGTGRKTIADLAEGDNEVEVLATIVQAFEPKFFEVCPQCGKRARAKEGCFSCEVHGQIEPAYSYLLNLVIDDGTENIRAVFFRNQAEKVRGIGPEELLKFRQEPSGFERARDGLLGRIVKLTGRVNKNQFFDRIELVARSVDLNPSPEEEIKRLESS